MTRPDRESRFDEVDLTALTIVELEDYLSKIVDRHVIIPDAFLARAYELRIVEVQGRIHREVAIRNRRETERQEEAALARTASAERRYIDDGDGGCSSCGKPYTYHSAVAFTDPQAFRCPVSTSASADRVRAVVERSVEAESARLGERLLSLHATKAIAERAAAQLTALPPGHVCPAPYALGPEDLDVLERLREHAYGAGLAVLNKIFLAHTCPEPTLEPLPEVIQCGTPGCVSSIKKTYLPSGWRLTDGVWACPRCKVLATTEAS